MQDRKYFSSSHSLPIMQPKSNSNHSNKNSELPLSLTTTSHHDGTVVGTMAVQSAIQQNINNDCTAIAQQNTIAKQPKPILIENKQFSEPNSPIVKTFDQPIKELHTIYRGYSDLGNRIKTKRVTLR